MYKFALCIFSQLRPYPENGWICGQLKNHKWNDALSDIYLFRSCEKRRIVIPKGLSLYHIQIGGFSKLTILIGCHYGQVWHRNLRDAMFNIIWLKCYIRFKIVKINIVGPFPLYKRVRVGKQLTSSQVSK